MIYTVTFNPSLDYVMEANNIEIGKINRSNDEKVFIGGKGINVSRILNTLGIKTVPLGFVGGFTGKELEDKLYSYGINTDFIHLDNCLTRINVKIRGNVETAINADGPIIRDEDINHLLSKLDNLSSDDFVVLAGNVPKSVDKSIYPIICEKLSLKNVPFIVDATGDLLLNVLNYRPFLIKPNKEELEEALNVVIRDIDDLKSSIFKLKSMGARNVLVSLGGDGALLIDEDNNEYFVNAPKIEVINTVGAGDSMIAGFIYGYLSSNDYSEAIKYGVSAGSATASCSDLATKEVIDIMYQRIK